MNKTQIHRTVFRWLSLILVIASCFSFYQSGGVAAVDTGNEMDPILKDFIEENIPDTADALDSMFLTNYTRFEKNQKISLNEELETSVFAYKAEDHTIYTVVSISLDDIRISEEDHIEVVTNEYLRPISPATTMLLTRNSKEEDWVKAGDIEALVNMSWVSIYGGEISSKSRCTRIILSFVSLENEESMETEPYYEIHYSNYVRRFNMLWIGAICLFLLVGLVVCYLFVRKRTS